MWINVYEDGSRPRPPIRLGSEYVAALDSPRGRTWEYYILTPDSVLPPPPRYVTTPGTIQLVETHNTIDQNPGPELNLSVGEGTYELRDDLHLATPPPHPSEVPVAGTVPNPLDTKIVPPTAGTRLSLAFLSSRHSYINQGGRVTTPTSTASGTASSRDSQHEQLSNRASSNVGSPFQSNIFGNLNNFIAPAFGSGNPALASTANPKDVKDSAKRKKPKSSLIKSNSSFVSRVVPHEVLTKRLQEHNPEGAFAFANVNRAFLWVDLSSPHKVENLTKILFTKAHALCHDVNPLTISASHVDVIMGFSTGDIMWYEPMSQKYSRLNKGNMVNTFPISDIKWLPQSENLFMAGHFDGNIVIYDKDKEDAPFIPEENAAPPPRDGRRIPPRLQVKKSYLSQNQKTNPVAVWKVSNQKINRLSLSPNGVHLAVASEDGYLRIIDIHQEKLTDVFPSYYGGTRCICWSPDGLYVLTGGQDDLISIYSVQDSILVARCQGHSSWVTHIAFDPWRCDERNYRFGSVGEDGRLLLWDFSHGMLHRPRAASVRQRGSISSAVPTRNRAESSATRLGTDLPSVGEGLEYDDVVHPMQPRGRTPMIPPVMAKEVDVHPLSWITFQEDSIITSCFNGHVKTWNRPKEGSSTLEARATSSASGLGSAHRAL